MTNPTHTPQLVAEGKIGADVKFCETVHEQARRLGVTERWVSIRRQVLQRMLRGESLRRSGDDVSYTLAEQSVESLLDDLGVQVGEASSALLIPNPDQPYRVRSDYRSYNLGGNPRLTLNPPFGYKIGRDGKWVADGAAARAVHFAFVVAAENIKHNNKPDWAAVAKEMNRLGYRRRDDRFWTGDDIRSLPRGVTYCGYGYLSKSKKLWRADETIPNPLVSADVYLVVARKAGGKIIWLAELEKLVAGDVQ